MANKLKKSEITEIVEKICRIRELKDILEESKTNKAMWNSIQVTEYNPEIRKEISKLEDELYATSVDELTEGPEERFDDKFGESLDTTEEYGDYIGHDSYKEL